jgi:hypothetical protein
MLVEFLPFYFRRVSKIRLNVSRDDGPSILAELLRLRLPPLTSFDFLYQVL